MDSGSQHYFATAAFLATHFISSTPLRATLVRALGEKACTGLYALVSFATVGWMAWAYNRAPLEPLWVGLRWLPAVLMPVSFVLLVCGVLARIPTMAGADKLLKAAEPARGMIRVARHPVTWAFILWSVAHILARGELGTTVFFGTFLLLAALGARLKDERKARTLGEYWQRFAAVTS